jgi:hypothetical protein
VDPNSRKLSLLFMALLLALAAALLRETARPTSPPPPEPLKCLYSGKYYDRQNERGVWHRNCVYQCRWGEKEEPQNIRGPDSGAICPPFIYDVN